MCISVCVYLYMCEFKKKWKRPQVVLQIGYTNIIGV